MWWKKSSRPYKDKNKDKYKYSYALVDEMRAMKTDITRLNDFTDANDNIVEELRVSVDDTEQYSRRANVRIQGIQKRRSHTGSFSHGFLNSQIT